MIMSIKMRAIMPAILILAFKSIQAQESLNTSGSSVKNENGSLSYSVGQAFFENIEFSEGSLSHGVQQSYIIEQQAGVQLPNDNINLQAKVYPNPTTDMLQLSFKKWDKKMKRAQLISSNGELLSVFFIENPNTIVGMRKYKSGIYFLKLSDMDNNELTTFRIIKQ